MTPPRHRKSAQVIAARTHPQALPPPAGIAKHALTYAGLVLATAHPTNRQPRPCRKTIVLRDGDQAQPGGATESGPSFLCLEVVGSLGMRSERHLD